MPRGALRVIAGFGLGKAITGAITVASVPVWVALFGPANYGLYSMYWATSLVATSFMTGWVRQAILRFSGAEGECYEMTPRRLRLTIEVSPVLAIIPITPVAAALISRFDTLVAFLVAVSMALVLQSRYAIAQTILQRDGRATRFAVAEVVRSAGALVGTLSLAALGIRTAWAIVAATAVATLIALIVSKPVPRGASDEAPGDREILRAYWRFGWPMSLWLTISSSLIYVDRFFLTAIYGLERAGQYAAAADIVIRGMGLLVAPVIMFLHPVFMRAWNTEGKAVALDLWRRLTYRLFFFCFAAVALSLAAYAMMGDVLLDEPLPLFTFAILAVAGATWQLALMVHKPLEAAGRGRVMLVALVVAGCIIGASNFMLARQLGELGVAGASLAGAVSYIFVVGVLNRRLTLDVPNPDSKAAS